MWKMSKPPIFKELTVKVKKVNKIKPDVFLLSFDSAFLALNSYPGQFLHVKIAKTILRRPFSVHYVRGNSVYLLFRIRGRGTKILSEYKPGDKLSIIGPLGKGFKVSPQSTLREYSAQAVYSPQGEKNILVAGGLGVAPLVFLAQRLKKVITSKFKGESLILLGAKDRKEILCEQEFKNMGYRVIIATEDGSKGYKGTITEVLKKTLTAYGLQLTINIYSCGPETMFKEIKKVIDKAKCKINCQVSFEQFMGCGLGICCGCTIETKDGYKKVCKDGPVFNINNVL